MRAVCGRSFVSETGDGGASFRALLFDEPLPESDERQRIAAAADEIATVFIAPDHRHVALHNRKLERPLISHALVGATQVCRHLGIPVDHFSLTPTDVPVWTDESGCHWLRAPAELSANDNLRQALFVEEVEEIESAPSDEPVLVWAWIDQRAGIVRARFFGPSVGKPEDEACGSACMVLAEQLQLPLTVYHGRHRSLIKLVPTPDGVECGGHCTLDGPPSEAA
jgi:predicted PhzF superfamily epimerase YddE/YHI9